LRGIQFRSTSTSPGVALWKIIQAETSLDAPEYSWRRRAKRWPAGLGVIDALKALRLFDHSTLAILGGQ
jgi:hypothetical protein